MRRHEFGSVKCAAMAWACGAAVLLGSGGARAGGIIGSGTLQDTQGAYLIYGYTNTTPLTAPGSVSGSSGNSGSNEFGSDATSNSWKIDLTSNALSFDFSSTASEMPAPGFGTAALAKLDARLSFTSPTRWYTVSITSHVVPDTSNSFSNGVVVHLIDSTSQTLVDAYDYNYYGSNFTNDNTFGSRVQLQASQSYQFEVLSFANARAISSRS
jgi:hypothetical protein